MVPTIDGPLSVPGAALYHRRAGAGPAVVAVHGGPGLSHEPLQAFESLARPRGRTVVNYDQRGFGRSSGVVDEVAAFAQAVADLDGVRAAIAGRDDRIHLVGHARGGLLAALYAGIYPDRVASLALIDSFPPTSGQLGEACDHMEARVRELQRRALIPAELPSFEDDGPGRLLAMLPALFVDPSHPAARSLGGASFSLAAYHAVRGALRAYDVRPELRCIRAPSLHVIAPVPFGSAMASSMAAAVGGTARRLLLRDAGHLPWLERPAVVLGALEAFWDEVERRQQSRGEQS
jgi:proline iminopeptidase